MIIILLIIFILICVSPMNTEFVNNTNETINVIREQNEEYMTFIPISNGKTVQMIMIPKIKGEE